MFMNKSFLVLAFLLLMGSVFAGTSVNTIQHFGLTWNENSNQLSVSSQCKGQTLGTLTLSNGMQKTMICSTMDVGGTWFIGDQTDVESISGTFSIESPCDVCSRTSTISLADPNAEAPLVSPQLFFGILMVLVIVGFIFVSNSLQR